MLDADLHQAFFYNKNS